MLGKGFGLLVLLGHLAGRSNGVGMVPSVLCLGRFCCTASSCRQRRAEGRRLLQLRGGGDGGGGGGVMEEEDDGGDVVLPQDERLIKGKFENGFRCCLLFLASPAFFQHIILRFIGCRGPYARPRADVACMVSTHKHRYIVVPNKSPRNRFVCNLVVFSGSAHENDYELGLAHYLEHCVFLGTERCRFIAPHPHSMPSQAKKSRLSISP